MTSIPHAHGHGRSAARYDRAPRAMTPDAILFDLYGTLLRATHRPFSRGGAAALGASRREWMALLRRGLTTSSFPDAAAFAAHVARSLAPDREAEATAACLALLDAECASVELEPGARSQIGRAHV